MRGTAVGTPLDRAMFPVPTGHAEARSVLALAVFVAPGVALFQVAELARPAGIALARFRHAMAVVAAIQVAQF